MTLTRESMEAAIRGYFDACNRADADGIASYFTADGTHYFPDGSPFGALRGAREIADRWVLCVRELGSHWTVDNVVADPSSRQAVIEWSHFKPKAGQVLRGDEWYLFDRSSGLIREIRAYYASPQAEGLTRLELQGFPYAERGYPLD